MKSQSRFTTLLQILLVPIMLLEDKLIDEKIKTKYGVIPRGDSIAAYFERWGMIVMGIFAGFFRLWIITFAITLGFVIAGFIDPFIWARKDGIQMFAIKKKDIKLGLIVNLAPIWLFWVGFLIGGGLGAV